MGEVASFRAELDWSSLARLRIHSKIVAASFLSGRHRSTRRGAGVEFGGYREYQPGDDLRRLDRRAMLRHDQLIIREFEAETERAVVLVVDTTRSMAYRGKQALASKYAWSAVLAAAVARIAVAGGDPVALVPLGRGSRAVAPRRGFEAFERVVEALERGGADVDAQRAPDGVERALGLARSWAGRGAVVIVFSDLIDLPDGSERQLATLGGDKRTLSVLEVLDPDEAELPFSGQMRLRALEGEVVIDVDPEAARDAYLAKLAELEARYRSALKPVGGRLERLLTRESPMVAIRRVLSGIR